VSVWRRIYLLRILIGLIIDEKSSIPSARERGMRRAALDIYYNKMSTHICARLMMMMLCMYMALINPLGYDLHDKRKGVGIP
jgi:hypothetical protein